MLDRVQRARHYVRAIGPAVEGSGGDERTYQVIKACWAFGLDETDAEALLGEWNATCSPPWSASDLRSKLRSVYRRTRAPFGEKLDDDEAPAPPPRPIEYPPKAEMEAWFSACPMGTDSEVVRRWIEARGLRFNTLDRLVSTMTVRETRPGPGWATVGGRPWAEAGYGVLFVLFDHLGQPRSCRARWSVVADDPGLGPVESTCDRKAKALPPAGYDTVGLCMLNLTALATFGAGGWPNIPEDQRELWIAEGEPDFLALCSAIGQSNRPQRPVAGIFSGSWTAAWSRRLPPGGSVVIATHDDLQGRRYAEEIQASVHGHARVRRFLPSGSGGA